MGLGSESFQDLCEICRLRRFSALHACVPWKDKNWNFVRGYSLISVELSFLLSRKVYEQIGLFCSSAGHYILCLSLSLKHTKTCVHFFLWKVLKHHFSLELFVAWPYLVPGWLRSQVLRQILQCRISPPGVGAKATQRSGAHIPRNPEHSGWNVSQEPCLCSKMFVCVLFSYPFTRQLLMAFCELGGRT